MRLVPVDEETIEQVAHGCNDCRLNGHALHQRLQNAGLWIAAAAIGWAIPLAANDAVFVDCPGLDHRIERLG